MKRHKLCYLFVLFICLCLLSSCKFVLDSLLGDDNMNDDNTITDNDSNEDEDENQTYSPIVIRYYSDIECISFTNAGYDSYVIEVDEVTLDDSQLVMEAMLSISYRYHHYNNPFDVTVKGYVDDVLMTEVKQSFYPMVIYNFKVDKNQFIATFDKVEFAESYDVYVNSEKYVTICEEEFDLLDAFKYRTSASIKIIPVSSKTGTIPITYSTRLSREETPNNFRYDGILNRFIWDHVKGSGAKYELVIDGGEPIIVEDVGFYDYVATKPISIAIKKLVNDYNLDSLTTTINLVKDDSTITSFNYDHSTKKISWDKLGDDKIKYSYYVIVNNGLKEYTYVTSNNYYTLSGLRLNNFEVKIIPDSNIDNRIYNTSKYNVNIYDSVDLDCSYDDLSNETIINISSTEEAIAGYNISILKNDVELFNHSYDDVKNLSFDDYNFLDAGIYDFICTPYYLDDDNIGVIEQESYKLIVSRLNKLESHTFDGREIKFSECQNINYVIDDVKYKSINNSHAVVNDNDTDFDKTETIQYYSGFNYSKMGGLLCLPSIEPLEITYTLLAPVSNVKLINEKIEWDYEGNKSGFVIKQGSNIYNSNDKFYAPIITDCAKQYEFSILPKNESYDVIPQERFITISKVLNISIDEVVVLDDELKISLEERVGALSYEFIIDNEVFTSMESNFTFSYDKVQTIQFRAIGEENFLSSDYSIIYNLNSLDKEAYVTDSNSNKTIYIGGLENYMDVCDFEVQILKGNEEYFTSSDVAGIIDVSNFDYSEYDLSILFSPLVYEDVIYFANSILDYHFLVYDFVVEKGQYGFENNYYPASIKNHSIYNKITYVLETSVPGMKSDYSIEYKEEVVPLINDLYDNYRSVKFEFIDKTSNYVYEQYNVFTIGKTQSFTNEVYNLSDKTTVNYYYDDSDYLMIDVYSEDIKYLTKTLLKDGVDYVNSTERTFTALLSYTSAQYDVIIKPQFFNGRFYTGTTFFRSQIKNVLRGSWSPYYDYTKHTFAKAMPISISYVDDWKFTGTAYYTIRLISVQIEHSYPNNTYVPYCYVRLTVDSETPEVYDQRYYNGCTFEFSDILLTEGSRLELEFFIQPSGYTPSNIIYKYYIMSS